METTVNLWTLIGILVIVIGFVLRFNAALVVIVAAFVTCFFAEMPPPVLFERLSDGALLKVFHSFLTQLGEGFVSTRMLSLTIVLPLATIGLLERNGLKSHAQNWIAKIKSATLGRLLIMYLFVREVSAALGLTSLGGHPQMVRPIIAPMAEGVASHSYGELPEAQKEKIRAMSAATDNVGLFFGEDIFVAFGAIVLMQTFMKTTAGLDIEPMHIAFWGIPTAFAAFLIHAVRLYRFDQQLRKQLNGLKLK